MHTHENRTEFFDRIAGGWDARVASDAFLARLNDAVDGLDLPAEGTVVDLGCGTGNLTRLLAGRLPDAVRIVAADFSAGMLDQARAKLDGVRPVEWLHADAAALPLEDAETDVVICFSAWPHFPDPRAVAQELHRVLRPGGVLYILHVDGRDTINRIHHHAGGAVAQDMLPPAPLLAELLDECGYATLTLTDEPDRYLVAVRRR